jgi:cell division initiation protein
MRITPIEIRQKEFEKKLRGYDKDDVNAFLKTLSSEWERIVDENKELKIKLEQSEKEVMKLREVESSLFKTLKTAEDTGANLVDQANKAAELHLKEAEINADAILNESKAKSKAVIENAEQKAKEMILEMQDAIKALEKNYQSIENQRDNLISELTGLANDVKERVKRTTLTYKRFDVEDHLIKVRELVRESEASIDDEALSSRRPRVTKIPDINSNDTDSTEKLNSFITSKKMAMKQKSTEKIEPRDTKEEFNGSGSFFDQVGD